MQDPAPPTSSVSPDDAITGRAREERAQLEAVCDAMQDGVAVFDMQGRLVLTNRAQDRLWGNPETPGAEHDVSTFAEVFHVEELDGTPVPVERWPVSRVLAGETLINTLLRARRSDIGREWVVLFNAQPVQDRQGRQVLGVVVSRDVTEGHQAEERLRGALGLIEGITEGTHDMIAAEDAEFRYLYFNDAYRREFRRLWGRDIEVGVSMIEAMAPWPEEQARARALWSRALLGETFTEIVEFGPSPDVREVYELRFNPVRDSAGRLLGAAHIFRNVTERVRMERALGASERRFRELADAMPQLVWTARDDGTVNYYNTQVTRYAGISHAPDADLWEWHPVLHPDDLDNTLRAWSAAVAIGQKYQCEHRVRMADGEYRWHLSRAYLKANGAERTWYGTATDIHELKLAQQERRAAEEELRRHRDDLERIVAERTAELEESHQRLRLGERMAALGTLSAGLGHDMGNILVPMRVWLDELARSPSGETPARAVQALRTSTEYLERLAAGLRALSLDPENAKASGVRTHLDAWWAEASALYRSITPRGLALHAQDLSGTPPVAIPHHALTQIVFNLVQNAGDAMREAGAGNIWLEADADPGAVHLRVRDDGPGMPEHVRQHCMEPFFTTKARGRGTGLGLSIVHTTLRRYNATISVTSETGVGTTFTLSIPLAGPETQRSVAAVSVRDARAAALTRALLDAMGVEIAPSLQRSARPAIWVVDSSVDPVEIHRFLDSDPRGRVVRLGVDPGLGNRVVPVVETRPAALREALARAVRDSAAP